MRMDNETSAGMTMARLILMRFLGMFMAAALLLWMKNIAELLYDLYILLHKPFCVHIWNKRFGLEVPNFVISYDALYLSLYNKRMFVI